MIEEERIKRSLVDQVRQLTAERDQIAAELNQRNMDDVTATIKGLELLVALAAAGNPSARLAVKSLLAALDQARTVTTGIVLVNS